MAGGDFKSIISDCPESPNCVSTLTDQDDKKMDAINTAKPAEEVLSILKSVVAQESGAQIIKENPDSLHFLFKTRLFRFKDDVYFYYDSGEQKLHFKSQSRSGHSDLGKNRNRMNSLVKVLKEKL